MSGDLAFGITAGERADAGRLGGELEGLGYAELWTNDTRRGDGVATLASIAPATRSLGLALGVVALSDHSPEAVVARLGAAGSWRDRLVLGVGSGSSASLDLVRDGVTTLRERLPGTPIAIAAVGPRMLHLAGEIADVVVTTWSMPERVPLLRARVEEGARMSGRRPPRLVLYVRTTLGPGAGDRLRAEMRRYAAYGRHYARAFLEQSDELVGIAVDDPSELPSALAPYRAVADTVVVRAVPALDEVDALLEIAAAAAPLSDAS